MAEDPKRFIGKVRQTIDKHRMLEDGLTVIVAVSGGPDSVALLHVLNHLKQHRYQSLSLHVAHVNHQLRGRESDEDETFVRDLAEGLGLSFTAVRQETWALAQESKRNLEEVAREERYRFFRQLAARLPAQRVATGHTLSDQAETVLMRLVRGAGGAGMSGIHPVVDDFIIRPLLGVMREAVVAYCDQIKTRYRVDRTNLDPGFTRNRIRLEIMPRLIRLNPRAAETLARGAENFRLDEGYLDQVAQDVLDECLAMDQDTIVSLGIPRLRDLHPALRRRVLRLSIRKLCGSTKRITNTHLEAIEALIITGASGQRLHLPAVTVWREFDVLAFRLPEPSRTLPPAQGLPVGQTVRWGRFRLTFRRDLSEIESHPPSNSVLLDGERLPGWLRVRARRPGDKYVPEGHTTPRKVKQLMLEGRIPVSQRSVWPIVVTDPGDSIVWSPQLPVAAAFAPRPETSHFALVEWALVQG